MTYAAEQVWYSYNDITLKKMQVKSWKTFIKKIGDIIYVEKNYALERV